MLAAETVKLYRSILEFQIRVICQIGRNTAHQFARNVVEADRWKEQLEQIRSCERACQDCMVILNTKERRQGMDCLESRLRDIDANFQQRSDALLSELKVSREDQKDWNMSQAESECLETLRTVDYESDKSRIADRVERTCEWFLSHEKYQSWLSESHSRLLWVTADPGCGKSVLSKFLVDSYSDNDTIGTPSICYFFFRDGSEKNQDGTNALCALLHQLFKQKRALLRHALPDFEHNKTKLSGLSETLWSIFFKAITDPEAGSIICIIDALDECGEKTHTSLLKHIGGFFSRPPTSATVKCIITSRPYTTIGDTLWEGYRNVSSVRLMGESESEMSTIQEEISLVIDKKVERFREKRRQLGIHDETHHAISEKLALIENRTYLWVSLIFPEFDKNVRSSQGRLLGVIEVIPSTVEEAYESILKNSTDAPKAQKLLRFVLAAQRPFTLEEMNTAIAITENCTSVDDLELEPEATFQETVRQLCGLFVSVSDSKIYLIHQTAREFLLASRSEGELSPKAQGTWMHSIDLSTSHFELAKTCLLYLHLSGLDSESKDAVVISAWKHKRSGTANPPMIDRALQRFALHFYSAEHWCSHAVKSDSEAIDSLMSLMLSITNSGSQAFKNWTREWKNIWKKAATGEVDQLSLAVYFELSSVVKFLLERGQQRIEEESLDRAAICAIRRYPDVFHIFLEKGLDLEVNVNYRNFFLHEAAEHGRIEVAQLLIEAGAAVNREDRDLREPLYFVVHSNSMVLLSLLIEKGARVNHRDKEGRTVLYEAIRLGNLAMTTYLLEHGAEYEIKDNDGRTPLSWTSAANNSEFSIAALLIKYGAEIDSSDCNGRTALAYAASIGHRDLTSLLIKHGARVDSKDKNGQTPLSYAAESQYNRESTVMAFLVEQGAQIETRCIEMRTPLSYAAKCWSIPKLRYLIENGAAVNSSDWNGNTPLMHAVNSLPHSLRVQATIVFWLENGANIVTVNKDGDSPHLFLERFFSNRYEDYLEVMTRKIWYCKPRERKPPTFSDTISQVVAQLTVNLIEIVTKPATIVSTDHQIAARSSAQLFRGWNLHPTVSSIRLQDNRTIEQETTKFVLVQMGRNEQDIVDSEKSTKERLGSRSGKSQPDHPSQFHEAGMLNTEAWEKSGNYGGLAPSQGSKFCSFYLHRLAELQQRIFNVNRCLYYLDSNPDDCSETIDDLIAKVTGQKSRKFDEYSGRLDSELGSDSSCEDDDVES